MTKRGSRWNSTTMPPSTAWARTPSGSSADRRIRSRRRGRAPEAHDERRDARDAHQPGDDPVAELDPRVELERRDDAVAAARPVRAAQAGVGQAHGGAREDDDEEQDERVQRQAFVLPRRERRQAAHTGCRVRAPYASPRDRCAPSRGRRRPEQELPAAVGAGAHAQGACPAPVPRASRRDVRRAEERLVRGRARRVLRHRRAQRVGQVDAAQVPGRHLPRRRRPGLDRRPAQRVRRARRRVQHGPRRARQHPHQRGDARALQPRRAQARGRDPRLRRACASSRS